MHLMSSREVGLEPFTGNNFSVVVEDGEVVSADVTHPYETTGSKSTWRRSTAGSRRTTRLTLRSWIGRSPPFPGPSGSAGCGSGRSAWATTSTR